MGYLPFLIDDCGGTTITIDLGLTLLFIGGAMVETAKLGNGGAGSIAVAGQLADSSPPPAARPALPLILVPRP